jgi:pyrroline-5-carboxylate reductase
MTVKLLLVGGGKMGSAMLAGWLKGSLKPEDVLVVEPFEETRALLKDTLGVTSVADASGIPADAGPATIVLAVKPQMMDEAIGGYARFAGPDCVFLSIAAGKTIAYFEEKLGADAAIVRAMPNTPAAVGRGITVGYPNHLVSEQQRTWADELLRSVGEVAWVDDEGQIDCVTALSGGGPAYVFLLVEVMAQAGIDNGLPADLAMRLARVTVAGAGELLHQATEEASQLRKNVTSPGGTTAEALKVLMADDALQPLMTRAIAEATRRSRELAG